MGGLKPGITTDTVAALVAQKWRADIMVKASDQAGIYTEDPRINKKAKKLEKMTYEKMKQILGGSHHPGIHSIVDPVAVDRLVESRVKLIVLNGADAKGVVKAIHGEKIGTVVT